MSDHIDKAKEATAWNAYVAANERYAQAILDTYQEGDLIWIHDYHLSTQRIRGGRAVLTLVSFAYSAGAQNPPRQAARRINRLLPSFTIPFK